MKSGTNFSYAGFFITFEGVEGCGKSTQISRLERKLLRLGVPIFRSREPGGPPISEKIRELLLDPANKEMGPLTEALLYQASRTQHVQQWILPSLQAGEIVLCDRFFDASTVYQGIARELGRELIQKFNLIATGGLQPDLTIIIDLPVKIGLARGRFQSRLQFQDETGDRIEQESIEFHNKVRQAYLDLAQEESRCSLINGQQSIEAVETEIYKLVIQFLDKRNYRSKIKNTRKVKK